MLLRKIPNAWALEELNPFEMSILANVGDAADPKGSRAARSRLFPKPGGKRADGDEEKRVEFLTDWEEYVVPDLKSQFAGAVEALLQDVATASTQELRVAETPEEQAREDEFAGGPLYRLEMPDSHAEHWFSALNQARLVLAEKHDLHSQESEEELLEMFLDESPTASGNEFRKEEEIPDREALAAREARLSALIQSQVYGMIQEWLLSEVMA